MESFESFLVSEVSVDVAARLQSLRGRIDETIVPNPPKTVAYTRISFDI